MTLLTDIWQILGFIAVQVTLGRRGSYPYGLLLRYSLTQISLLIILCDAVQILILLTSVDSLIRRLPWLARHFERRREKRISRPPTHWLNRITKHRFPALVFISALPYGGGALSGSLFALSCQCDKPKAFVFIIIGCILGTLIYHLTLSGFF
jgi:uncharacterized membrane protein